MKKRATAALTLALALLSGNAAALDRTYTLAEYQHTTWSEKEGAPPNVLSISQTPDGYLWLASARGLYRFDGFTFDKISNLGGVPLNDDSVTAVFGGPSGELVLNMGSRGAAVFTQGRLLAFPSCSLGASVASTDKQLWAICNRRPVRFVADHFEALDANWGLPGVDTLALVTDSHGMLWASTEGAAWSLAPGARAFRKLALSAPGLTLPSTDGSMWWAGPKGIAFAPPPASSAVQPRQLSDAPVSLAHVDRDGGFWAANAQGLIHVGDATTFGIDSLGSAPVPDVASRLAGSPSDTISAMFEGMHGSLWIGTASGLERYRNNALRPLRLPGKGLAFSIGAGRSGELWAASYTGKLMRVSDGTVKVFDEIGPGISCIARDSDGSVWVAADNGNLWHLDDGKILGMLKVPLEIHGSMVTSVTRAKNGDLWVGSTINGMIGSFANGHWNVQGGHHGLPDRWSSRTVLADTRGRVWASAKRSEMILLANETTTRFGIPEGLDAGEIFAIVERGPHLWVGGSNGVAFFDGRRFQTLKAPLDGVFSKVTGVLEASNGDLWVHEYDAVKRVPAAEVAKAIANPDYLVAAERFSALDGLYGNSPPSAARATIAEGSNGLIWLSTSEGVMSFDPARQRPRSGVPKVFITSALIDGIARDVASAPRLGPQTKSVRILYAAVSPGAPDRIRYRYRLDGLDTDWYDAGTRRAVTYTSLLPGNYRFRVSSTDEGGHWAENETALDFRIAAVWYQTDAVRIVYVAAALITIWLIYRMMLIRATRRVRWQMRMRQTERDRIARDLHDTLLQGIHGLTWKIQTIANGMSLQDTARTKLETALDTAEVLLTESRRRVLALRDDEGLSSTLSEAIRDAVAGVASAHPCGHELKVSGVEVAIQAPAQMDICDVARESFLNAVVHGHATLVKISLVYTADALLVSVHDNGSGIDPRVAKHGRPGHWGLIGMRERAKDLGGSLEIAGVPGNGTTVTLRVRGSRVFGAMKPRTGVRQRMSTWLRRMGRRS